MSFLTSKQKSDLHNSILNYLKPLVSDESIISSLQKDLLIDEVKDDNQLLPKKWNAIIRLQKKILDLESQVDQLSKQSITENSSFFDTNTSSSLTKFNWIPSKVKKSIAYDGSVTAVAIHPSLPQMVAASSNGTFTLWSLLDLVQPINTVHAHLRGVNAIAISPTKLEFNNNNHVLVTCGSDLQVKIWDLHSLKLIRTLSGHEHVVSSVVFRNENQIFTSSRDTTIKLWDLKLGWCLKSFVGHSDWVRTIDLTASEYILSGSNDQSVRLSHGESGTGLGLMIGHEQVVEVVRFIPSRSNQYVDKIHSEEIFDQESYNKIGFKYAVTGGRDDIIRIWLLPLPIIRPHNHPLPSSNPQGTLVKSLVGHKSWIKDLTFHPNGRILLSCSDDMTIKLWDLENGDCIRTLRGHEGFVNSIAWASSIFETIEEAETQDEQIINDNMRCLFISGGTDEKVRVWE